MGTVTLQLTSQCSGGGHLTFTMTGDVTGEGTLSVDEIDEFLNSVGRKELLAVILRLAKIGRTPAQVKTLLQAGVTVTI